MKSWLVDVRGEVWGHIADVLKHVADRAADEAIHVELCVSRGAVAELKKLAAYLNIEDNVEITVDPQRTDRPLVNAEHMFGMSLARMLRRDRP
ncbi:hypothetical protein [Sphingobium aquiterrae]|uniref:hypothetical protein n=1 Tax=Sphingobium aquiterrae TaxID=2038656 RepID=UPI0030193477